MALETGEHPFVFKSNGIPVFVKFPTGAEKYFTPQEMMMAEQLLLADNLPEKGKPTDLAKRLFQAGEKAKGMNQSRPVKEIPRGNKDKLI